jgi:hypothetical protein
MGIKSVAELKTKKLQIDLTGPQGNAFWLLAQATSLCKQLGLESKVITDDMMAGDYEHLLEVFEANFGNYVDLYR